MPHGVKSLVIYFIALTMFKDGKYVSNPKYYANVERGEAYGLFWGGNCRKLVDKPHLEIPLPYFKVGLTKNIKSVEDLIGA